MSRLGSALALAAILALAPAARAGVEPPAAKAWQPPADPPAFVAAKRFYRGGDFVGCEREFAAAARQASRAGLAARAWVGAATCAVRGLEIEAAFEHLGQAIQLGLASTSRLEDNADLAALATDSRWLSVLRLVGESEARARAGFEPELLRLYEEDQADRAAGPNGIDWSVVAARDSARRARVRAIVERGGARVGADFYHAAMVLQHGETVADFELAHVWAKRAVDLDPDLPGARWLAAATLDRALMTAEKPQRFGTQFRRVDGRWSLYLVEGSTTDAERDLWDVPPLASAHQTAALLNSAPTAPPP